MEKEKIVKLSVGILLLAGLVYIADFSEAVTHLSRMNLWLYTAAVAVFMTGIVTGGVRWLLFNRLIEEELELPDSIKVYLVNYSLSTVFIGNLAEAGRYKVQERYVEVENKYAVTGAVAVEKIFDIVAILGVIGFSLVFVFESVAHLLVFPVISRLKSFTRKAVGEGSIVIDRLREDRVSSLNITLLSLAIWWLEAVAFHLIAMSLGIEIAFFESAITTSMITLASGLPITPSGLGTAESAGYVTLAVFGISSGPALALIVGQRFLGVVLSSLPGATIYINDYMFR